MYRLIFVVLLVITFQVLTVHAETKQVLFIDSYDPGMKFSEQELKGVKSVLFDAYPDLDLRVEYMDTKHIYDENHIRNLYSLYAHKFQNIQFDLIIAADDSAFSFVRKYHNSLFNGSQTVFLGVNFLSPDQLANQSDITGVIQDFDSYNTLRTALSLFPDTKDIYIIHDQSETGISTRKQVEKTLPPIQDVRIQYITNVTISELADAIEGIPKDSIILLEIFNRDTQGGILTHEEAADLVSSHAKAPVFVNSELMLNHGSIGGKITTGYDHGALAGDLSVRILNGESADTIPIIQNSPNRYIFDHEILKKYGIKESSLPPGSEIINKPEILSVPIWLLYITLLIIGLCAIIIGILLYHIKIRSHIESNLRSEILERQIAQNSLRQDELRLEALLRIHRYPATKFREILDYGLSECIQVTESKNGFIIHLSEEMRVVSFLSSSGDQPDQNSWHPFQNITHLFENKLFQDLIRYNNPLIINDSEKLSEFKEFLSSQTLSRICAISHLDKDNGLFIIGVCDKIADYDETDIRQLTLMMDSVFQIIDRREAIQALHEKTEFLSSLITHANTLIFVWDPNYRITEYNQALETLSGYKRSDMLSTDARSFLQPSEDDNTREDMFTNQECEAVEMIIRNSSGEIKITLWNSGPVFDTNGELLAVIAMGIDITRLKEFEIERKSLISQIERNITELAILNDGIRNPLTIINTVMEISDCECRESVEKEVKKIDSMVTQLDNRWLESEKIFSYLQRHYGINYRESDK